MIIALLSTVFPGCKGKHKEFLLDSLKIFTQKLVLCIADRQMYK